MSCKRRMTLAATALACLLVSGAQSLVSAQGRGGGRGQGGPPPGVGRGAGNPGMGRPSGAGVERGLGTASERSGGRSDEGLANASARSRGRSDAGLERARLADENRRRAEEELREHPGVARMLHTPANRLRADYEAALAANPNLKFGQFVAATRLAANLGGRYPNVTRAAILSGLARGDSIGETLRELGVGESEAREAKKRAEREIKEARKRS